MKDLKRLPDTKTNVVKESEKIEGVTEHPLVIPETLKSKSTTSKLSGMFDYKNKKVIVGFVIFILIIILVLVGYFFFSKKNENNIFSTIPKSLITIIVVLFVLGGLAFITTKYAKNK